MTYGRSFENARAKAEITDATPHTLRHTFASGLAMNGVNSLTLQLLGRWEEPKMVQRYAHLSSEHLVEALEKIQPAAKVGENFTTLFTQEIRRKS